MYKNKIKVWYEADGRMAIDTTFIGDLCELVGISPTGFFVCLDQALENEYAYKVMEEDDVKTFISNYVASKIVFVGGTTINYRRSKQ